MDIYNKQVIKLLKCLMPYKEENNQGYYIPQTHTPAYLIINKNYTTISRYRANRQNLGTIRGATVFGDNDIKQNVGII